MNFLKKTWVAIALTVIMVVAAIGVGQLRAPVPGLPTDTSNSASGALDTSLSTSEYDTWISRSGRGAVLLRRGADQPL